jgi:hypothetical protein
LFDQQNSSSRPLHQCHVSMPLQPSNPPPSFIVSTYESKSIS